MAGSVPAADPAPAAANGAGCGDGGELAEAEEAEEWLTKLQEERRQLLSENERLQDAVTKAREMAQRKVAYAKRKNDRLQVSNLKLRELTEEARLVANARAEAAALEVLDTELAQALQREQDEIRRKVMAVLRKPCRTGPGNAMSMTEPPTPVATDL